MRKILISLLCLILVSCNELASKYYSGTISEISKFKFEGDLKPQPYLVADSFACSDIYVIDSLMIVGTGRYRGGITSIYDMNQKKRLLSIGQMGKGQYEYMFYKENRPYVCPKRNHVILNTFDGMTKFREIDITESLLAGRMIVSKEESYGNKYFRQMDYNLGITIFPDGRKIVKYLAYKADSRDKEYFTPKYVVEDADGKSRDLTLYPEPVYGINDALNTQCYRSNVAFKPDGTKIVEAMELFDFFSIVDVNSGKVKGFCGEISYTIDELAEMTHEILGTKPYNVSRVHASDHYFFTVKYNLRIKDLENIANIDYQSSIQIYDWDGKALAKLMTGSGFVGPLFYDEGKEILYTTNSKGNIVFYDLAEVMKKIKS